MKISEIYKWTPIKEEISLDGLLKFDSVLELGFGAYDLDWDKVDACDKIVTKYYTNVCFDGRRTLHFYSIWFENTSVMLCRSAGREGDDHLDFFITNEIAYREMIEYIRANLLDDRYHKIDIYDSNEDIPDILNFYSTSVNFYYNPEGVNPKYKVGDIVIASVPENHLQYKSEMIKTRVKIEAVFPYNPTYTYRGTQIDREYKCGGNPYYGDCKPGKGTLGATLNDDLIDGIFNKNKFSTKQIPAAPR